MRQMIFSLALLGVFANASAFDFGNINLNKLGDMVDKATDAFVEVDETKEIAIGHGVASRLLTAVPLVRNPALQAYVNEVGLWLALQSERPDLPWRFGVIDTDGINAFAAPGGYIFITRGLFAAMRDEAELAGVLAHEIVHVLERHHLDAIQHQAQVSLATDAAKMAAKQDGVAVDMLVNTGVELYARGLDKDDEYEADVKGVVIAARAGYAPDGLFGVLATLDTLSGEDSDFALMFKTHPLASDRISRLQEEIGGRLESYADHPRVAARFEKMQAQLQ